MSFRPGVAADFHSPERAFGFFTITAALNVLGARFGLAGHPVVTAVLAAVSGLWSVGLLLYLIVVVLILMHWLTEPMTPATFGPPYWILTGATAISVLAGARALGLPARIPLLVILGLWRHVRRHWPLTYEPTLRSVVFPLGMYSVAALSFGKAARLGFMEPLARFMIWVAVAARVLAAAAFVSRPARGATAGKGSR